MFIWVTIYQSTMEEPIEVQHQASTPTNWTLSEQCQQELEYL